MNMSDVNNEPRSWWRQDFIMPCVYLRVKLVLASEPCFCVGEAKNSA